MARPVKWRRIERMPTVFRFAPSGGDPNSGVNILKIEEIEAIRLKDLEDLEQSECASQMEVSRPTFQRILLSARGKIADSLINGKEIQIEGGHYTRNICPLRCLDCGREWRESLENIDTDQSSAPVCPQCHSDRLVCVPANPGGQSASCRRRCRRHGQF